MRSVAQPAPMASEPAVVMQTMRRSQGIQIWQYNACPALRLDPLAITVGLRQRYDNAARQRNVDSPAHKTLWRTCYITPPITLAKRRIRTYHVPSCKQLITQGDIFQGHHDNIRGIRKTTCPTPPKRLLLSINEMSPPPSQRQTADQEHHLSPMAGQHPDIPADAAMAITSPPRRLDATNGENQSPPNSQS